MTFDDRVTISTPEGVSLEMVLAGLGSRFAAGLLDVVIELSALYALFLVFASFDSAAAAAILYVLVFLVLFGYDVFFETVNQGRTPGKMAAGVRVVRIGGAPIGFLASAVRNLLRIVDGFSIVTFVLAPVGMITIVASRRNQRLGDLAAGTVVMRERKAAPAAVLGVAAYAPDAPFLSWDVSAVTADEVATIRRFLDRRATLTAQARAQLGWDLATRVRTKVAGAPDHWHPEAFLEGIVAAKAARG